MSFAPFVIAAVALAVTPGPGIACVVARTAAGGRAEGLASCLGTGMGGLLHVLAAALGLSLLVAQSAMAFGVVRYVGAADLVESNAGRAARALLLTRASGVTLLGLGACLALAAREA